MCRAEGAVAGVPCADFEARVAEPEGVNGEVEEEGDTEQAKGAAVAISDQESGLVDPKQY